MTGLFATKAEAQAFALTVFGWACRAGMHGNRCGWFGGEGGLRPWPMPIGHGVAAWCQCECHHTIRGVLL